MSRVIPTHANRSRACEYPECKLGGVVFTTRPLGPVPRMHPDCWRHHNGGAPAMGTWHRRRTKGLCVVCMLPSGDYARCRTCRLLRSYERTRTQSKP